MLEERVDIQQHKILRERDLILMLFVVKAKK
jgi:hypothetical protein